MRKFIGQSIFAIYNLLQNNRLQKYYNQVKEANDQARLFKQEEISGLLKRWGFKTDFLSNPLMTKEDVKRRTAKIDQDKIHSWAYTGGSFGEPLRIPYSKERSLLRTATFKYFNESGGYSLGDPFALIRAKDKSSFIKFLRNETIVIPQDISEKKLVEIFGVLEERKVKVLMGYPTVMYEMALFLKENISVKERLTVRFLISVSEMLEPEKRQVVKNVFDCSFIDRYSNEEVGLIAQQKEFGGPYHVNKFCVYVEIVDPVTLQPVKEGEQGKVVVTDLYNDLVPIIRYDTGDLAIAGTYQEGQLFTIQKILGRVAEKIFDSRGKPVSSLALGPAIYKPFSREGKLFQFQFVQVGEKSYELRVKNYNNAISYSLEKEILDGLIKQLGSDADIVIKKVKDIKPQPSGKRPVFKNEYKK